MKKIMTSEELVTNFAVNLEKERIHIGYTQLDMARALDISLSTYKNILNGTTTKLPMSFGPVLYKLTGRLLFEFYGEDVPELKYLETYRKLPKHRQKMLSVLMETECELAYAEDNENKTNNSINTDDENCLCVFVPIGNVEDGMIYDSSNIEIVNISKYKKIYGDQIDCGLKITSNHLHPVYHVDDILLISRRPPRDGDTAIFINRNTFRVYIRKFRQTSPCRLEPIVDYGSVITVDSNDVNDMKQWIKFGVVLTKCR